MRNRNDWKNRQQPDRLLNDTGLQPEESQALTETPSAACTRTKDWDQEKLETLAADLRRRLTIADGSL